MDAIFGRNNLPLSPEIEANRRQFMNEYREIQAQIALMNNDTGTERHTPTLATSIGGRTSDTAIEITEEGDCVDDHDVI